MPDDLVVRLAVYGSAVFVVASAAAVAAGGRVAGAAAVLDLGLFALGTLAFAQTLLVAARRSRTEELSVAGIWFLSGSAPSPVRRWLLGALAVQVVVALLAASLRPYTSVAFGILVPMFGLGACGLWAVRAGTFPPRAPGRPD